MPWPWLVQSDGTRALSPNEGSSIGESLIGPADGAGADGVAGTVEGDGDAVKATAPGTTLRASTADTTVRRRRVEIRMVEIVAASGQASSGSNGSSVPYPWPR